MDFMRFGSVLGAFFKDFWCILGTILEMMLRIRRRLLGVVCRWRGLSCMAFFAITGFACLARCCLPVLALLVLLDVVCHCWRCFSCSALLAFAGVAGRSCTLPFADALPVLLLAQGAGGDGRVRFGG